MAMFRLQALAPKRLCVGRNADGSKRFVEFTPDHTRRYVEQGNAMLAAGLHVPAIWEHRDDGKPRRMSFDDWNTERTKGVAGWVSGLELIDGRAIVNVEIPDAADAKQAEKVRFCSPEIDAFTDSTGRDWGEVFTHIALTPRPVQHDQPPIARLSHGPIRLAINPTEGTDMADEKKTPEGEGDGGTGELKSLIEALKVAGLTIPDEVTDIPGLIIAIKASAGEGGDDEEDDLEDDLEDEPVAEVTGGVPGGMQMSLQKQQEKAVALAKANAKTEIDLLLRRGQITPEIRDDLTKRLGTVRLSFNNDGELKRNDVMAEIAAYAKLPRNHAGGKQAPRGVRLSNVKEIDPLPQRTPEDGPDDSPEARKARIEAFQETIGRR